ncbi:hypothetical protein VZ94_19845 [Methylocucumis oryzae]|uniref:Acyltransferase 3 domain-containing protein n=1 Tax=Methylocucumis oryzae TaxID=1632867 RepID=A0A0F3IEI4_9GAMM|nr:acyltransferase family protein [Methylocucumis oryzae]KJV05215.1 hypothetical protein VZ94_19845 [Methylocucumis oryzae]
MTKQPLHIAYLDAVRGLAALSVVNEHYVIAYGLPCQGALCSALLDYSPLHIWWDGTAAVSMFFVLSGLVLSYKYVHDAADIDMTHYSLTAYLVSRLCRIGLPYLAVLALSALLYEWLHDAPVLMTRLASDAWINQMWRGHALTHWAMLKEAFLLRLPADIILIPQAWTLSIELVLSLLLPLALLLLQRSWRWLVFFTVFIVMFANVSPFALHFMLGMLIAKYGKRALAFLAQQRRVLGWLWVLGFCYIPQPTVYISC